MKGSLSLIVGLVTLESTYAVSLPSLLSSFDIPKNAPPAILTPPSELPELDAPGSPSGTGGGSPPFTPSQVESDLMPRQSAGCENSATSRDCWGDYNIDTNYYVRRSTS